MYSLVAAVPPCCIAHRRRVYSNPSRTTTALGVTKNAMQTSAPSLASSSPLLLRGGGGARQLRSSRRRRERCSSLIARAAAGDADDESSRDDESESSRPRIDLLGALAGAAFNSITAMGSSMMGVPGSVVQTVVKVMTPLPFGFPPGPAGEAVHTS